jgi:DNA-binding NtrC family response regulator
LNYRKAILHVDDDAQFTRLVAQRLATLGYEVTSLNQPSETLRVLADSHHRLVLLDIDMPGISGLDLLRQIKVHSGGTQVIMLTGTVSMQTLLQSYRWGAEFFVFKPLASMDPLLSAIETVFQKIDHWWAAMEHLGKERRAAQSATGRSLPVETSGLAEPTSLSLTRSQAR